MTLLERAQWIANNGMQPKHVDKFFTYCHKKGVGDIIGYITIFGEYGIDQNTVWDMYELWQNDELVSIDNNETKRGTLL